MIVEAEQLNERWTNHFKDLLNRPVGLLMDGARDEYNFQYDIHDTQDKTI